MLNPKQHCDSYWEDINSISAKDKNVQKNLGKKRPHTNKVIGTICK